MMKNKGVRFCREVEDELSSRRFRSDRILNSRIAMIRRDFPEVYAIWSGIKDIGFEMGLKIMDSPDDAEALSTLARELTEAKQKELSAALLENGFPSDFLEKQFVCPICEDTGIADGQMCSCTKQVMIEAAFKGSGLNQGQSFTNFRRDLFSDPKDRRFMDQLYSYCENYAKSFPENELQDLLLMGVPGVGKTYLLNCIGSEVLERGYSVLRITANRLVSSILDSIRDEELERPDFILPDLLIIDDLGTEPMINNITVESLLSILSERQDAGKSTLIATNKGVDHIQEDYGQRIFSRLFSPQRVKIIEIKTPSIRMMKI